MRTTNTGIISQKSRSINASNKRLTQIRTQHRIGSNPIGLSALRMTNRRNDRHSVFSVHRHNRDGIYQCLWKNYVIIHVKCLKPLLKQLAVAAVVLCYRHKFSFFFLFLIIMFISCHFILAYLFYFFFLLPFNSTTKFFVSSTTQKHYTHIKNSFALLQTIWHTIWISKRIANKN